MKRSVILAASLGIMATLLLAISATFYYERPTWLTVAVSAADADDFDLIGAAARLIKHGHHPVRLRLLSTDGIAAASAALDAGQADLAVVRTDVATPAKGETVVLLHKDAALLVAPAGSDIEKIADLTGKRIGMLSQRVGDRRLLDAALAQYDVGPETVEGVPLKVEEVVEALTAKTVDAVFVVGQTSGAKIVDTVRGVAKAGGGPPVFLSVAEAAAIAQRTGTYESIQVVRGAFGGTPPRPADEFDTLGVTYRLVASSDLGEDVVASLTRFLLAERVALAQVAPGARRIEAPSTDKGAALPVHPGTAAYIDDEEETFLERYSDVIYIGAMVLGVMASGLTAVVGRLGAQGAARIEDLMARLSAIFKAIRPAPTLAVLDHLEDEVDAIVAAALDDGGLRNLDERRVAALNLALDQVRSGLRERRETLRRLGLAAANDKTLLALEPAQFRSVNTFGSSVSDV